MKAKLAAGAAVLAVTCLVGGAMISESVFANDDEGRHAAEIAALQAQLRDGRRDVEALEQNLEIAQRRSSARVSTRHAGKRWTRSRSWLAPPTGTGWQHRGQSPRRRGYANRRPFAPDSRQSLPCGESAPC